MNSTKIAFIFDAHIPWTTGNLYYKAARALNIPCERFTIQQSQALKPGSHSLYFRIDHGDCSGSDLPRALKPAVFYALDTHLEHSRKHIARIAPRYDLVFCPHRSRHALKGAYWLPYAAEPFSPEDHLRDIDISAVGNDGGIPRKFILQALRERYPNNRITAAPFDQLNAIYSHSKIGFNYSIRNEINLRCFEVLMAGALLLSNTLPLEDMRALELIVDQHFVVCSRASQLFDTVDRFLAQSDERIRMAKEAQRIVLERHTYQNRVMEALVVCQSRLGCTLSLQNQA